MSHSDVFVIGAGPAGLTAAYLLTKQGIATTVIEVDPHYVGGIARTVALARRVNAEGQRLVKNLTLHRKKIIQPQNYEFNRAVP